MVINIIVAALAWLLFLSITMFFARVAWLIWFHPERVPSIRLTRSSDPSVIRGHARGVLPFVGFPLSLTVMLTAIFAGSLLTGEASKVVTLIGGACVPGLLLSVAAHSTVAWFNWPKFLAPPHLRDETGSIVEWFRHRRDLRIALKEAAERDALDDRAGHRRDPHRPPSRRPPRSAGDREAR
ncbi:hypothetical protein [Streptacidiphilus sp. EB103A]|uniref:hypothetical protein n=1 Tax=Streptacidiphilus sp. EB103A TaxID=3156275 RepID=UPI00351397BA